MRKGSVLGIVENAQNASSLKASIKSANFALKKISVVEKTSGLPEPFIKTAKEVANFYTTTTSNILGALLPKIFFDHPEFLSSKVREKKSEMGEIRLLQLSTNERLREYRSIIRENFAQNKSVLFIAPTQEDLKKAYEPLRIGIENFVFTTFEKKGERLKTTLMKTKNEKHPILLLTTFPYLSLGRDDFGTIILERENSRAYRLLKRPYINIKTFLEFYIKNKKVNLILGDSVLSIESLWKGREGLYNELTPLSWRLNFESAAEIVDMQTRQNFNILSERLINNIKTSLYEGKNIFLFGTRKGLSPSTICGDCASLLLCKNCQAPLVLHEKMIDGDIKNIYICHHCGAKRNSETRCDNCQSWKLYPLGIGVDRIVDECQKIFPEIKIMLLDKDHVKTGKQAKELIEKFENENGSILVGTELALNYLKKVPLVSVVSLDSLFSIPDFYINEKIFYLITRLRELSKENFLIQTRNAKADVLEFATAGNVLDFYRAEIKEREELRYPPFSLFIKVSKEDTPDNIKRKATVLQNTFDSFEPHFILKNSKKTDQKVLSMILRIKKENWPDKLLKEKLLLLTPDFLIKVDPESIL